MNKVKEKACERCNRQINHNGCCLPCNYLYKHRAYFPGVLEAEEYDLKNHFDINLVKELLSERKFKKLSSREEVTDNIAPTIIQKIDKVEVNKCGVCEKEFDNKNGKYTICLDCYRFYHKFGGIKSYQVFLIAFKLEDTIESKENYIEFVDNFHKFVDVFFQEE